MSNSADVCVTPGCNNQRPARTNYHRMSVEMAIEADPRHHRCRSCYLADVMGTAEWRTITTRKPWQCHICESIIERRGRCWAITTSAPDERYFSRYPDVWRVCSPKCRNKIERHRKRARKLASNTAEPNPYPSYGSYLITPEAGGWRLMNHGERLSWHHTREEAVTALEAAAA